MCYREQFVVHLGSAGGAPGVSSDSGSCAIVPLVQVAGTVTRRAVEPTWLTASNAKVKQWFLQICNTVDCSRFSLFFFKCDCQQCVSEKKTKTSLYTLYHSIRISEIEASLVSLRMLQFLLRN